MQTNDKEKIGYPSIDRPWLKYYTEKTRQVCLPSKTIYEYIYDCNQNKLNDTAFEYFKKKITYKAFFEKIDVVASALVALGVKQGDVIPILLPNIPENFFCMYAFSKIGAVGDYIDLRLKGEKLVDFLNESNSKIAIICDLFAESIYDFQDKTNIQTWIIVSPFEEFSLFSKIMKYKNRKVKLPKGSVRWKDFLQYAEDDKKTRQVSADAPVCIFHTSGTTGEPKGGVMSSINMNAIVIQYKFGNMEYSSGDRFLNQIPPFLAYNEILSVHMPLSLHMTVILLPDYKPDAFLYRIYKYRPNHVTAWPAVLSCFENEEKLLAKMDLSSLKTIACGSDSFEAEKKQRINKIIKSHNGKNGIMEGYGMTEAASAIVTCWPNADKEGSVGIPHFMNIVSIFSTDDYKEELPEGETGEICVTGPSVMNAYFNNKVATNEVLKIHDDNKVWLHTGDLGHMDEDGFVYIDGRIKRLIIRHDGIKVSPFEIEQIIKKVKGVKDVCVVGTKDASYDSGEVPTAYIVADSNDDIKGILSMAKNCCNKELEENYRPHFYRYIGALPLTPNGKVDYRLLTEMSNQEYENEA